MATVDEIDELIERFNLAQGEFLKGNVESMNNLISHKEDVTLNSPYPLPRMDGSGSLRPWSVPHRSSEMAR
jgi:hypothetical protein